MQTIENIKKGLACLGDCTPNRWLPCSDCDWHGRYKPPCRIAICEAAIALIEQLLAEKAALLALLAPLSMCDKCKRWDKEADMHCVDADYDCSVCQLEDCKCRGCTYDTPKWEWAGIKEDEHV